MKRFIAVTLKTLKSREMLVCIIVYPLVIFLSSWLLKLLMPYVSDYTVLFGVMSVGAAALLIVVTVWEIFNRLMNHRIQGGHLAIRQRKGVEVPDGINERNTK